MFRNLFLFTLLLLSCRMVHSQSFVIKKIEEKNSFSPEPPYVFPLLEGDDSEVCLIVNNQLQSEILFTTMDSASSSIFEEVWQQSEDDFPSINYLGYSVHELSRRLLSITISGEWCSAYCEGFERSFNFNLENGNMLRLAELFDSSGQRQVLDTLNAYRQSRMLKQQMFLQSALSTDTVSDENRSTYLDMMDMYDQCPREIESLDEVRFWVSEGKINTSYGRCSAHFNRAIDDLWYSERQLKISEWKKYLSKSGKRLL